MKLSTPQRHSLFLAALTLPFVFGCQSEKRTQELVQARLDAEKVKELSTEVSDLKKSIDTLKAENEALKNQLLSQKNLPTYQAPQNKVALGNQAKNKTTASSTSTPQATGSQSPTQEEADLKKAATGGSSFK